MKPKQKREAKLKGDRARSNPPKALDKGTGGGSGT